MADLGQNIKRAADLLEQGCLVGIPTETVYGLAANGLDTESVLDIFNAKNRPQFDPLILHTDRLEKILPLVKSFPDKALDLAGAMWPGPLTLLLEKSELVPDLVTSGLPRVAVRIPRHPLTLELLQWVGFPLAAPSANPFGYISPTCAEHVQAQLGDKVSYILDGGQCEIGLESTVVGFEEGVPVVYRLGGSRIDELEALVGEVMVKVNQSSNPAAPGMIKSHYAPAKPFYIGEMDALLAMLEKKSYAKPGLIFYRESDAKRYPQFFSKSLSVSGGLDEAAHSLFSVLREFDQSDVDVILSEVLPDSGLGKSINDRLRRAAAGTKE